MVLDLLPVNSPVKVGWHHHLHPRLAMEWDNLESVSMEMACIGFKGRHTMVHGHPHMKLNP